MLSGIACWACFFWFGSLLGQPLFVLVSALVFLHGFFGGSLLALKNSGSRWFVVLLKALIPYIVFLVVVFVSSFLF